MTKPPRKDPIEIATQVFIASVGVLGTVAMLMYMFRFMI